MRIFLEAHKEKKITLPFSLKRKCSFDMTRMFPFDSISFVDSMEGLLDIFTLFFKSVGYLLSLNIYFLP